MNPTFIVSYPSGCTNPEMLQVQKPEEEQGTDTVLVTPGKRCWLSGASVSRKGVYSKFQTVQWWWGAVDTLRAPSVLWSSLRGGWEPEMHPCCH